MENYETILNQGMTLDDWACDVPEPNGGIESLVEYYGDYYSIIVNAETDKVIEGQKIDLDTMDKEGHVWDTIQEHIRQMGD